MRDWELKADEPWKRKYNFIPQKYGSLRQVPAYDRFIKERFERCLDLYLCPRAKKMRVGQITKSDKTRDFRICN